MSGTKWTPGPWVLEQERTLGSIEVRRAISTGSFDSGDPLVVDLLWLRPNRESEKAEANAQLIAAAPDLYEAIQELLKYGWWENAPASAEKARAASAKARGEA